MHKNKTDPPLRPVISMSGTVTHDIAQQINSMIRPYINKKYITQSSDETILLIKKLKVPNINCLTSLDVGSLFTNVPLNETINIIIDNVYHHPTLPPLNIEKDIKNITRNMLQGNTF